MHETSTSLRDALALGLRTVFQPIVELDSGRVVAHEALTRGPEGTDLANPEPLFAAARREGLVEELDAACLQRAVAAGGALGPDGFLFVNVEPATLSSAVIDATAPVSSATGGPAIVLEVTERELARRPEELLAGAAAARERGWRIALDDVGVDPASVAFLPVLRPSVVKLDMSLVHDQPERRLGATMASVLAYAERTGAVVLAEGIETDEHLERAVGLGASWGQGWRYGRPTPRSEAPPSVGVGVLEPPDLQRPVHLSPFDAVAAVRGPGRVATKRVLLQISHHLEAQALVDPASTLVLSAFQDARHFTPDTRRRYRRLGGETALCAAFGLGLEPEPVPGVRGRRLLPGDPLEGEWSVVVLAPNHAGALLGRDLGDAGAESDRRFRYHVTHDRELVELAAESLMRRIAPLR